MLTSKHYQNINMSLTEYHKIENEKYMVTYTAGRPITTVYHELDNDECEAVFTGTESECRDFLKDEGV